MPSPPKAKATAIAKEPYRLPAKLLPQTAKAGWPQCKAAPNYCQGCDSYPPSPLMGPKAWDLISIMFVVIVVSCGNGNLLKLLLLVTAPTDLQ
eukprot:10450877-Alexandrium_andersonii.AAC.1